MRAISAIAVVISHTNLSMHFFGFSNLTGWDLAGYGVTIFFTLSGFLITYLLLREKQVQSIDIKKFYIRRILRIWPLYFFYIVLVIVLGDNQPSTLLVYYFLFLPNIPFTLGFSFPHLSHFWSLGVEEQFYLFWPWLVKYSKQLFLSLLIFIAAFLSLKIFLNLFFGGWSTPYTFIYVSRFDCMAIGGVFGWIYHQRHQWALWCCHKFIQLGAWLILLAVAVNFFHIFSIFDHEIVAAATAIIILGQVHLPKPLINLENPLLTFLGRISFGMYVYHPLVIYLLSKAPIYSLGGKTVQIVMIHVTVVLATIVVSYLSFQYFEQYFLRLKNVYSFQATKSSSLGNP